MEWALLAMAPDQIVAEMWIETLRDAGIPAMIRPSDSTSILGVSGIGTRVQVRKDDLARARDILGLEEDDVES